MQEGSATSIASLLQRIGQLETTVNEIRSLVGPFGTLFPDGSMLVQTIHGTKYFIDPTDEIMAPQLVVYRQWEPELSAYMINSTTPDTVLLDVGANFGYFTCLAGSRIGPNGTGRVIGVEPNPLMHRLLRKNIKINWSMCPVILHKCAVTEGSGYVEFSVPTDRAANASLVTSVPQPSDNRMIVKAETLDNIAAGLAIDIIKIDVEGFETSVLRSAGETIARSPNVNIVIEWSQQQMSDAGFSAGDLISMLRQYDLHSYRLPLSRFISEAEWAKLEIPLEKLQSLAYDNILLRRRG